LSKPRWPILTRQRLDRMKKNRIAKIETYKTRAELIAQNPIRDGDDEFLNGAQVCSIIGISSSTLSRRNTERPPSIPFIRLKKNNYRYRKSDVEAYLQRHQIDQRKLDRRSDNIESPIQRRTGDRRRVDRV
jgi:predicted DNA-binding transcriptional regulator AlpA